MAKKRIDDQVAIELYKSGKTLKEIAAHFNSKWGISVSRVLRKHGIRPMHHWERFDASMDYPAIISKYLAGESMVSIAKQHGTEHHAIRRVLRKSGIAEVRSNHSYWTLPLNHAAFDVSTEESDYWAGLLMADGNVRYVSHFSPQIRLELSIRDKDHVEKFKQFVGASEHTTRIRSVTRETGNRYSYSSLCFASHQIANALAGYGVIPNKTRRTHVAESSNNRHFWRGVVDGDGCLFPTSDRIKFELIGSKELMTQFAEFISAHLGFMVGVCKYGNRSVWTIAQTAQKAAAIIRLLYSDCHIYLDRKKQRADYLLSL